MTQDLRAKFDVLSNVGTDTPAEERSTVPTGNGGVEYYDDMDDECPNCGGEGIIYDCIDGCCADAEMGCELCAYRCDWCRP